MGKLVAVFVGVYTNNGTISVGKTANNATEPSLACQAMATATARATDLRRRNARIALWMRQT